jgi:hypothetical protein
MDSQAIQNATNGSFGGQGSSLQTVDPSFFLAQRVDDGVTDADVIYMGYAPPGTAESAAAWTIKKIDQTVSGITTITFAGGNAAAQNIWANRGDLTYL